MNEASGITAQLLADDDFLEVARALIARGG